MSTRIAALATVVGCAFTCGCGTDAARAPLAATPAPTPTNTFPDMRPVVGQVVDDRDRPVADARLQTQYETTVTDGVGAFAFDYPARESGRVTVSADGYEAFVRDWAFGYDQVRLLVRLTRALTAADGNPYLIGPSDGPPLHVGETYESPLCGSCVRVVVDRRSGGASPARIHLRWTTDAPLGLWAVSGSRVNTGTPVEARHLMVEAAGSGDRQTVYIGTIARIDAAVTAYLRVE